MKQLNDDATITDKAIYGLVLAIFVTLGVLVGISAATAVAGALGWC